MLSITRTDALGNPLGAPSEAIARVEALKAWLQRLKSYRMFYGGTALAAFPGDELLALDPGERSFPFTEDKNEDLGAQATAVMASLGPRTSLEHLRPNAYGDDLNAMIDKTTQLLTIWNDAYAAEQRGQPAPTVPTKPVTEKKTPIGLYLGLAALGLVLIGGVVYVRQTPKKRRRRQ